MATVDNKTLESSANLSFWYKIQSGDSLTLADMPEIIPARWGYFRDNWPFMKTGLINLAASTTDPDYFLSAIDE